MSIISSDVTRTVVLGTSTYGTALSIAHSGSVYPSAAGAAGLIAGAGISGVLISNHGEIQGGGAMSSGSHFEAGGIGVELLDAAFFANTGEVAGGNFTGAVGDEATSDHGGIGLVLAAAAQAVNRGDIGGGSSYYGAYGGDGAQLAGGARLTNFGTIGGGGAVAGFAGAGVDLSQSASFINRGRVVGGQGDGVTHDGVPYGGDGGFGLRVGSNCSAVNFGSIDGGSTNYDEGSARLDSGASGAIVYSSGTLANLGTISAGNAGDGATGPGVILDGGMLTNSGLISGEGDSTGVEVLSGTVINTGRIEGGGSLGYGVYLGSGTLVTSGTISSGSGQTAAVIFGADATLVVEAGAAFVGGVVASDGGVSILELDGGKAGTLTGLGSEFTGFTLVEVASNWTLTGANTLAAGTTLVDDAKVDVAGSIQSAGSLIVKAFASPDTFNVASGGSAQFDQLVLEGGTVNVDAAGGRFALGDGVPPSGGSAAFIGASGVLTGNGTFVDFAGIVDDGLISASAGGTLHLEGGVSGSGSIVVGANGTIGIAGGLQLAQLAFAGPGEVSLDDRNSNTATVSGFGAGDVISLGSDVTPNETFLNGTLTIKLASGHVDTFHFSDSYTAANFQVMSTGEGVFLTYVAPASEKHLTDNLTWGSHALA